MGSNQNLKAYVRYDGSGRVVAGSLIFRRKKPKVGRWHEIAISECCEYIPGTTTTTSTSTSTSTSTTTTTTTLPPLNEVLVYFNNEDIGTMCSAPENYSTTTLFCTATTLQAGAYVYNSNDRENPTPSGFYLTVAPVSGTINVFLTGSSGLLQPVSC